MAQEIMEVVDSRSPARTVSALTVIQYIQTVGLINHSHMEVMLAPIKLPYHHYYRKPTSS